MEEFIFSKVGGFPCKIAVLKIKYFLVASAIIIYNIITSLEQFCISVSIVSREILVIDYCISEKWAQRVSYYLAGWNFHRHIWVFKHEIIGLLAWNQHGNQNICFIPATMLFFSFCHQGGRIEKSFESWFCSEGALIIENWFATRSFQNVKNCIFVNNYMTDEYINYSYFPVPNNSPTPLINVWICFFLLLTPPSYYLELESK